MPGITDVEQCSCVEVTLKLEDGRIVYYRRFGPNGWERLYGNSWEDVHDYTDGEQSRMEEAHQVWVQKSATAIVITVGEPVRANSLAMAFGTPIAFRPPIDLEPKDLCVVVIATGELLEVIRNDVVTWRKD